MPENVPINHKLPSFDNFEGCYEHFRQQSSDDLRLLDTASTDAIVHWLRKHPSYISDGIPDRRQQQIVTEMHKQAKQTCSEVFRLLASAAPNASRQEINANPELTMMNALRRALRHELRIRQKKG